MTRLQVTEVFEKNSNSTLIQFYHIGSLTTVVLIAAAPEIRRLLDVCDAHTPIQRHLIVIPIEGGVKSSQIIPGMIDIQSPKSIYLASYRSFPCVINTEGGVKSSHIIP